VPAHRLVEALRSDQRRRWHAAEAARLERTGERFAAVFHLDRLAALGRRPAARPAGGAVG
jgi:hypothetical protein